MKKEAQDDYIKSQVDKHTSAISEVTQKAVQDAISENYDPPASSRGGNALLGSLIGIVGGPYGMIAGAAIGGATEGKDRKEYDEVYKKTKDELEED